uniref:Uncharacterized protein n=1 Tax=Aegilops tauschii TaxID=37682 RepID=R7W083_AEGTA
MVTGVFGADVEGVGNGNVVEGSFEGVVIGVGKGFNEGIVMVGFVDGTGFMATEQLEKEEEVPETEGSSRKRKEQTGRRRRKRRRTTILAAGRSATRQERSGSPPQPQLVLFFGGCPREGKGKEKVVMADGGGSRRHEREGWAEKAQGWIWKPVYSSKDDVAAATSSWWTCVLGLRRCDDVCSSAGVELGR